MTDRIATLRKQFTRARAGVDASNRELRQASAHKLAALLASNDKAELLQGLKDPALTQYDRDFLERRIAELLPRRRIRIPSGIKDVLRSSMRHARYHWRGLALIAMMLMPLIAIGVTAAHHTGQGVVQFSIDLTLVWLFPDGHSETIPVHVGSAIALMERKANGDARLRYWNAASGYGEATMTAEAFGRYARF